MKMKMDMRMGIRQQQESVENNVVALEILKLLKGMAFRDDDCRVYSMPIGRAVSILEVSLELLKEKSKELALTNIILE